MNRFQINVGRLLFLLLVTVSCQTKKEVRMQRYTCPMHPEIVQDKPGTCPICFMDLVKVGSAESDGSVRLNDRQIELANISTSLVTKRNMTDKTILNAKIAVDEMTSRIISSPVQGRIERLFYKETGVKVKQGEPLYEVYSESLLILQREYLLSFRQAEELRQPRYESLLKASEKKLLLLGMTPSQIGLLAGKKTVDARITLVAPASGTLTKIDVVEGQYVSEGSTLFRVEQLDKLWVEAELYPGESVLTKIGDSTTVQVSGFENDPVAGKIIFLSPEYREGNQIITLRAAIDNPDGKYFPGMQANMMLTRIGKNAIVLPLDAVLRHKAGSEVWMRRPDGAFVRRAVKTGEENEDEIEITEGLTENESVVVTGAYLLNSESIMKGNQHIH